MLDEKYLMLGLNALARAHTMAYFVDGHRGGAIISAYFLSREQPLESGAGEIIARRIDEQWGNTPLCAPFPEERADPGLLEQIRLVMLDNLPCLRQAGHNVILPTLALRAFQVLPEAITPLRVEGICQLIRSFIVNDAERVEIADFPDFDCLEETAEFVLDELVGCVDRFHGRGQGWSGHLLTYSRALADLRALGETRLAQRAEDGFRIYLKRIRSGPQEIDIPRPETVTDLFPLQQQYWASRAGDWKLGHIIKYPYGFYFWLDQIQDEGKREMYSQAAASIF